jgi:hypothetical protein
MTCNNMVSNATRRQRKEYALTLVCPVPLLVLLLFLAPISAWTPTSTAQQPSAAAAAPQPAPQPAEDPNAAAADQEIQQYYAKADAEVQEYVRWTAKQFGRGRLWLPENAFANLTPEEREAKIKFTTDVLHGEYGRHQCEALAAAGALKDKRLLPGLLKVAAYHREDGNYDCRAKWMAVAALGRLGDESAVPTLVSLVDHGNQNTRMWARASLARITGQGFGADKQAWGNWWNASGKQPQITPEQLKPWKIPETKKQ